MKTEIEKITFKNVLKETKAAKLSFSMPLLYFSLSVIFSLCLAYVVPFSLIVTVPFLMIPSYFAFTSLNAIKGAKYSEGATFLKMFKAYFSQFFFGGYRLFIGFLKSLLGFIACNSAMFLILEYTFLLKNDSYKQILEKVQTADEINALMNEINLFLQNNEKIQKFLLLSSAISLIVGAVIFIQHVFKESIKMRRNLFSKQPFPVRQYHFVDRRVRKDNRKTLFSTYFRTGWFIQFLVVLAGAGGIVLSYFFLKEFSEIHSFIISLFLMFLVTLPFMNYISKTQDLIYVSLMQTYEETFATLTLEFLDKYKDKIGIEEEEAKKIAEMLEAQKATKEEKKKDDSNNPEK